MTQNNLTKLSRAEKIILVLNELCKGKKINLKYEDIVVAAFKKFPEDFGLRGYSEYPDSGDLVHKPLYDLRKKGYLEANNKVFSFTDRGMNYAEKLANVLKGKPIDSNEKMSRFTEKEISRIESTEAFNLFMENQVERITDTDFYGYLSVTPRTLRNEFLGRLKTIESAVDELQLQKNLNIKRKSILAYHKFMLNKFNNILEYFKTV